MKLSRKYIQSLLGMLCLFSVGVVSAAGTNPCAAKGNPCAAHNPCAMKSNPCAANNPCAAKSGHIDPVAVRRPAGTRLAKGNHDDLVKEGGVLWNDTKLSSNGMSCNTCHENNNAFSESFAKPYPHGVGMVKERAGISKVHLDEMVQFCMLAPMASKPFPWDSRELAALTTYAAKVQKTYKPGGASKKPQNPCGAMKGNPCAMKANPCGAKNPCDMKQAQRNAKEKSANPCAANPCAAKTLVLPRSN